MATFAECGKDVYALRDKLLAKHHGELKDAGVTIKMLFAHAARDQETGEPKGPAIKHHGYPAAGLAKINSHEKRVAGEDDCQITLDGDAWPDFSEDRQLSIIDHELTHFEVRHDPDGNIVLDDCHRPKLRMRLHDVQIGAFAEIAERYGADSLDVNQFKSVLGPGGQLLFPWCQSGRTTARHDASGDDSDAVFKRQVGDALREAVDDMRSRGLDVKLETDVVIRGGSSCGSKAKTVPA